MIDPCQTLPIPGGVHHHPENERVLAVTPGVTLGSLSATLCRWMGGGLVAERAGEADRLLPQCTAFSSLQVDRAGN